MRYLQTIVPDVSFCESFSRCWLAEVGDPLLLGNCRGGDSNCQPLEQPTTLETDALHMLLTSASPAQEQSISIIRTVSSATAAREQLSMAKL